MKGIRLLVVLGIIGALTAGLAAFAMPVETAYAQNATVTLSPTSGFAMIAVSSSGFMPGSQVLIYWDWDGNPAATPLPTFPETVLTDVEIGSFTAFIAVPTPTAVGQHRVWVSGTAPTEGPLDGFATFTVVDMRGLIGATGATGAIGPVGPPGATGAEGPRGLQGPAGPAGPAGSSGATGATGATGEKGPVGPTGPAGPMGPAGTAGAQGEQGPAGEPASMGGLIVAIIASLVALGIALFGVVKKVAFG